MKSYVGLIICLLAVPGSIAAAQTLDSALAFYPMAIGNVWQFDYRSGLITPMRHDGYGTRSIAGDTLMPNGRVYKVQVPAGYSYGQSITFLRIDSGSAIVFQYTGQGASGELMIDSLLARPGDVFSGTRMGSSLLDTILGQPTVTKMFYLGPFLTWGLSYRIGPISFWWGDYSGVRDATLVYAKIKGQEYGTLVSANTTAQPIPKDFQLSPNSPNPFNPSTTIRYALAQRAHVTVTAFNTLGQVVATLVNEIQEAGYHNVRFDGTGLASGVYFYRIVAGTYVETKKLVILR